MEFDLCGYYWLSTTKEVRLSYISLFWKFKFFLGEKQFMLPSSAKFHNTDLVKTFLSVCGQYLDGYKYFKLESRGKVQINLFFQLLFIRWALVPTA